MATNSINLNNETELSDDNEEMDVEQLGITEEDDQHQSEGCGLAGPLNLFACMHYIRLCQENSTANERIEINLDDILKILSTNSTDFNNEIVQLDKLAQEYVLTLYICIIDQTEKIFYFLNNSSEQRNQKMLRACLAFDKRNRSFYPFYRTDNNKQHTVFSTDDTSILKLFEKLVGNYNWPGYFQTIQQLSDQGTPMLGEQNDEKENISINNINRHSDNADKQLEIILKGSGLCHLLTQQVRDLIPYVGPQLDNLNFSFQSSAYQLNNNDFTSLEAAFKALQVQLQTFLKLSDWGVESLKTNRITHTSTEITETTSIVRDTSSNNHGENILPDDGIIIEPSLRLNAASTIFENPSQWSINNSNSAIKLSKGILLNQPTRLRRQRTLEDLRDNICPAIQVEGTAQGTLLKFKLPKEINDYQQEFYLGIHAVTYDRKEHDRNILVPINTSVKEGYNLKTNDLSNLIIRNDEKNCDEFNRETKGVFSRINPNELKSSHKEWTFKMVNLYQDHIVTKELIKTKKLKWCRLMFAIYIKLPNYQFERVSPPAFSDLIKETYGAQSVNVDAVVPDRFCENGGQMIYVPLDQSVKKKDLLVYCNYKVLDGLDYQIDGTILSFETPERQPGEVDLEVTIIDVQNVNNWVELYHFKKQYLPHDNHPEPCGVMNKD